MNPGDGDRGGGVGGVSEVIGQVLRRILLLEKCEGLLDAGGDCGGIVAGGVVDFEDGRRRHGEGLEGFDGGRPVDVAVAWPEVLVFEAVVVVDVDGGDVAAQGSDGFGDAYGDVGMAEVKTDADVGQVAHLEDDEQVGRRGGLAGEILDEQADAKGAGKGAEVFEGVDGELDAALGPAVVAHAEVEDEVAEGDLLGGFEGALDLVHGIDAAGFLRVQDVDGGRTGAAHLAVREERGVHGKGLERVGAEPGGQLGDVLAAGVVEVLAGGKDFDCLGTGPVSELQQAGVEALVEEQVRGQDSQHGEELPSFGWLRKTNRTLHRLSHFAGVYGEAGAAEDGARWKVGGRPGLGWGDPSGSGAKDDHFRCGGMDAEVGRDASLRYGGIAGLHQEDTRLGKGKTGKPPTFPETPARGLRRSR